MRALRAGFIAIGMVAASLSIFASPASAAATDNVPDQAQCDSGSTTFTWNSLGIDRPVVTAMKVDGVAVPSFEAPADGGLGVAVCANVPQARKTGVFVYRRAGSTLHSNLAGAAKPGGGTIDKDTRITLTLGTWVNLLSSIRSR